MPKSISQRTRDLLSEVAKKSDGHRLLKLLIDRGLTINEIAEKTGVSRVSVSNWSKGGEIRKSHVAGLEKLSEACSAPTQSRFVISQIREEVALRKADEERKKAEAIRLETEQLEKAVQEKEKEARSYALFLNHYGRALIEEAIAGETSHFLLDHTHRFFDLDEALSDRGFNVVYECKYNLDELADSFFEEYKDFFETTEEKISSLSIEDWTKLRSSILNKIDSIRTILNESFQYFEVHPEYSTLFLRIRDKNFVPQDMSPLELLKLSFEISEIGIPAKNHPTDAINEIIQQLFDEVEQYQDDDPYLNEYYVSWSYPEDISVSKKDCIQAKFLDWLSDKYGKLLISEMFSRIETSDLEGKKSIEFSLGKHKAFNEYTHDELRAMLNLFGVDFPFSAAYLENMFSVLGYSAKLRRNRDDDQLILFLSWS